MKDKAVDKERVVEIVMKSGKTFQFDASWYVIDKCRILNVYSYRFRGIRVFSASPDTWEHVYYVEAMTKESDREETDKMLQILAETEGVT